MLTLSHQRIKDTSLRENNGRNRRLKHVLFRILHIELLPMFSQTASPLRKAPVATQRSLFCPRQAETLSGSTSLRTKSERALIIGPHRILGKRNLEFIKLGAIYIFSFVSFTGVRWLLSEGLPFAFS